MKYITRKDYSKLHPDYRGIYGSDEFHKTKWNGKKTWLTFVQGEGTCLLIEDSSFKFVEPDANGMIEIECPTCDGDGTYEVGPDCLKPAWDCCGGCYKTIECSECEGSCKVEVEYEPLFED